MKAAKVNHSKTEILRMFRSWADQDSTWEHHAAKLRGIECIGRLPPPDPDFPQKIRHPAPGTSMDARDLRHAMRDVCRAVAVAEQVSNEVMTAAWNDRLKCERLYTGFIETRTGEGAYIVQRRKISNIRDAETRERKMVVLEAEKRRLASISDEAGRTFSRLQDERFPYDQTCRAFPEAFEGYKPWIQPDTPEPIDERNPVMVKIDEIDWDTIVLSEEKVYLVETLAATTVGHVEHGPLFFPSKEAGEQYVEDHATKYALAETRLVAETIRDRLRWYAERHRFIGKLPPGGQWLFLVYPALLVAAPPAPEEYETRLAAIHEPENIEW